MRHPLCSQGSHLDSISCPKLLQIAVCPLEDKIQPFSVLEREEKLDEVFLSLYLGTRHLQCSKLLAVGFMFGSMDLLDCKR